MRLSTFSIKAVHLPMQTYKKSKAKTLAVKAPFSYASRAYQRDSLIIHHKAMAICADLDAGSSTKEPGGEIGTSSLHTSSLL